MQADRLMAKIKCLCNFANELRQLSTCKRKAVAAIAFPIDCSQVYAIGYNGPATGLSNDVCIDEPGKCGCVHAEVNVIAKMNLNVAKPSLLYSTTMPCSVCAGRIINAGVFSYVLYDHHYRNNEGEQLLRDCHVYALPIQQLDREDVSRFITRWKVK